MWDLPDIEDFHFCGHVIMLKPVGYSQIKSVAMKRENMSRPCSDLIVVAILRTL
jgi:hypothetical protein